MDDYRRNRESLEIKVTELLRENLALRSRILELENRVKMLAKAWADETSAEPTQKMTRPQVSVIGIDEDQDLRKAVLKILEIANSLMGYRTGELGSDCFVPPSMSKLDAYGIKLVKYCSVIDRVMEK